MSVSVKVQADNDKQSRMPYEYRSTYKIFEIFHQKAYQQRMPYLFSACSTSMALLLFFLFSCGEASKYCCLLWSQRQRTHVCGKSHLGSRTHPIEQTIKTALQIHTIYQQVKTVTTWSVGARCDMCRHRRRLHQVSGTLWKQSVASGRIHVFPLYSPAPL